MSSLDSSALHDLRDMLGDESLLADIIECYLVESPLILASITSAIENPDILDSQALSNIKASAHKLKSSSASLAAITLADICKQIEEIVGDGNLSEIENLIAQLKREYMEVEADLKKLL